MATPYSLSYGLYFLYLKFILTDFTLGGFLERGHALARQHLLQEKEYWYSLRGGL